MSAYQTDAYERRKKGAKNWSQSPDLVKFVADSTKLLKDAGGPCAISIGNHSFGPYHTPQEIGARLAAILPSHPLGTKVVVAAGGNNRDPQWAYRRVGVDLKPANTEGSPAIDLIYAAVLAQFGPAKPGEGVYSLGIYAAKPGEHGATGPGWKGNAWDIGVLPVGDTPANRARLKAIGEWLRDQAMNHGLPVGGIISQGLWCSKANGWKWETYHSSVGDLHFTHIHLSGDPEAVPGWI